MRTKIGGLLLAALAAAVVVPMLAAADADPAVQKKLDNMLGALKSNNRDAFVVDATEEVQKDVTKEKMEKMSKEIGPRLDKGYEATYLGQLKQSEHQVHLWKLTFKDGGDDALVRMALKNGKVGGFFYP